MPSINSLEYLSFWLLAPLTPLTALSAGDWLAGLRAGSAGLADNEYAARAAGCCALTQMLAQKILAQITAKTIQNIYLIFS